MYLHHFAPPVGFGACFVMWFALPMITASPPTDLHSGLGFAAIGAGCAAGAIGGGIEIAHGATTVDEPFGGTSQDLRLRTLIMAVAGAWTCFLGAGILVLGSDRFFALLDR